MSYSPQFNNTDLQNQDDYLKQFGFEPEKQLQPQPEQQIEQPEQQLQPQTEQNNEFQQFGFEPEQQKAGVVKSAGLGLLEGTLGVPGMLLSGVESALKPVTNAIVGDLPTERAPNISNTLESLPKSEGQTARRVREGARALPISAAFGIPGILMGLVGSQAGQTVREVFGKEGEFEEFGAGELSALTADILFGGVTGLLESAWRNAGRTGVKAGTELLTGKSAQAAKELVPAIFKNPKTYFQKVIVKNTIQGEQQALNKIIGDFGKQQITGFEKEASKVSPNRYVDLLQSSASEIEQQTINMFKNSQLSLISPLEATPAQGGKALQEAANATFKKVVVLEERRIYAAARDASKKLSGEATQALSEAKKLRADLTRVTPTPEQQQMVSFLESFIGDLETTTPAYTKPASKILNAQGVPITAAEEIAAVSKPKKAKANDLVDLVQRANNFINYDSQYREQSHRLKPIVATLRRETGDILSKNPAAKSLYNQANELHGRNAEVWGTKYMRSVRFSENPEDIIGKTKKASNMANLKHAITDPAMQGLAERMVVEDITQSGSSSANRNALRELEPELRPGTRTAARELIDVKDPLTSSGGRAAVRNQILKDAAQSVNTGKRPDQILQLMETQKGYNIVKESLQSTPQGRELFKSFERLFLEDFFNSIKNKEGQIDFKKTKEVFKNRDVKNVVQEIGGDTLVKRFNQLESFAQSFENNMEMYKSPETKSFLKSAGEEIKRSGVSAAILHAMGVPKELLAVIGLGKLAKSGLVGSYAAIERKVLSDPKAMRFLEEVSRSSTKEQLAKQLPRLINRIEEISDEQSNDQ